MATNPFHFRRAARLAMALSLAAAASCSDGGGATLGDRSATTVPGGSAVSTVVPPSTVLDTTPPDGTKAWTVMVYMAGDNNLEQDAIDDLREMQAGVTDQINVIAILDRSVEFSSDPFGPFGDWTGTRAMQITPTEVKDLGITDDLNMATEAVLESFVAQVTASFPAEHRALFLWDHAGGWRGYASDAATGEVLTSDEVASAVGSGLASAGVDKLDVLVYDACLMADSEVVLSMAPIADILLASEEVVPSHGNNYASLAEATTGDARTFATVMIEGYQAEAAEEGSTSSITMSAIDLTQTGALDASFAALADAMAGLSGQEAAAFLRSAGNALAFAYSADPAQNYNLRDLGQIVTDFSSTDPAIQAALGQVNAAIDAMVIQHIEGSAYTGARGVSVYLPTSIEYYDTRYSERPAAASWAAVLNHVYNAGADAVVDIDTSFTVQPQGLFDASGVSIVGGVDPALIPNLVEITVVYGLAVEDGTFLWLGAAPGAVIDPQTGLIGGTVPLLRFEVSVDGFQTSLLGSYSATPNPNNDGTLLLSSSVIYSPPGQPDVLYPLTLRVAVDATTGEVLSKHLYGTEENGTVAEFTVDPAGTLQLVIPLIDNGASIQPVNSAQFDDPPSIPADLAALDVGFQESKPGDGTALAGSPIAAGLLYVDSGGTQQFVMVAVPTE